MMNGSELYLSLLEPPEKGFRFRYKSELTGSHGKLKGANSKKNRVTYPTVKLENTREKGIVLQCSLVTENKTPHVHKLYGLNCDEFGVCKVILHPENDMMHSFQGLVIQYEAKKNIRSDSEGNSKDSSDDKHKSYCDLNKACLLFQAFRVINGIEAEICPPLYTDVIKNLKNPQTGDLRICRISSYSGVCTGNEEVWILVEKVRKDDIQIVFFETVNDQVIWSKEAHFNQSDVHHQYAIVFRTPEYRELNLVEPVKVKLCLRRPLDNATSNEIEFMYIPKPRNKRPSPLNISLNDEMSGFTTKRPNLGISGSSNFTNTTILPENSQIAQEALNSNLIETPDIISILSGLEDKDPFSFSNIQQAFPIQTNNNAQIINPPLDSMFLNKYDGPPMNENVYHPIEMGPNFTDYRNSNEASLSPCPSVYSSTGSYQSHNSPESVSSQLDCNQPSSPHSAKIADIQSSDLDVFRILFDRDNLFCCDDVVIDGTVAKGIEKINIDSDSSNNAKKSKASDLILAYGNDFTEFDDEGNSVFHYAAFSSPVLLKMLFMKFIDPILYLNVLNFDGFSPLHLAVLSDLSDNVMLLIQHKCNINLPDGKRGYSALHLATEKNNPKIIKLLLDAGADKHQVSFDGTVANLQEMI